MSDARLEAHRTMLLLLLRRRLGFIVAGVDTWDVTIKHRRCLAGYAVEHARAAPGTPAYH